MTAPGRHLAARLLAAWTASGMPLGKLLVYAANEYALGAAVSLPAIADEALVWMVERYVEAERRERRGSR